MGELTCRKTRYWRALAPICLFLLAASTSALLGARLLLRCRGNSLLAGDTSSPGHTFTLQLLRSLRYASQAIAHMLDIEWRLKIVFLFVCFAFCFARYCFQLQPRTVISCLMLLWRRRFPSYSVLLPRLHLRFSSSSPLPLLLLRLRTRFCFCFSSSPTPPSLSLSQLRASLPLQDRLRRGPHVSHRGRSFSRLSPTSLHDGTTKKKKQQQQTDKLLCRRQGRKKKKRKEEKKQM